MLSFSRREEPGHGYIQIIVNQRPASDPKGSLSAMTSLALLFTAYTTCLSSTLRLTLRYMGSTLTQSLSGLCPCHMVPSLSFLSESWPSTATMALASPVASPGLSHWQVLTALQTNHHLWDSHYQVQYPAQPQPCWTTIPVGSKETLLRRFCLKDAGLNHKWCYSSMWWVPVVPAKQIFHYSGSGLLIITTISSTPVDQNHRLLTRNSKQPW